MNVTDSMQKQKKQWRIPITIGIIVALLILFDLSPFGGNARFYAAWIGCGRKPMAEDISIGLGAQVSHYIEPNAFQPFRLGQPDYFCTPLEAEQAGYSASPSSYDFPHLRQEH